MKLDKEVRNDLRTMAVGCLVCTAIIMLGFLIAGSFDLTVVIGGVIGWLLAFGNFFFMSIGVIKALETGDESTAKLKMRSSYLGRTVVMLAVMVVALIVDWIHWVPVVASVFFPRIVITARNLINLAVSRKQHLSGNGDENSENDSTDATEASNNASNLPNDDEDEENDALETFMKGFYKGTVPGEEKSANGNNTDAKNRG